MVTQLAKEVLGVCLCSLAIACSEPGGGTGGDSGTVEDAMSVGEVRIRDAASTSVPPDKRPNASRVRIEHNGIETDSIVFRCNEACADVGAVATGGGAPYTFEWEDGSKGAIQGLCPTTTSHYTVSVTDSGSGSDEFKTAPLTARANVTVKRLECQQDSGTPTDATTPDAMHPTCHHRFA